MSAEYWKFNVFLTIFLFGASLNAAAAITPSHSYDLTTSLADSLGGPSLVPLGGTLVPGTGYVFGANQGLNLSGAFANPANYSIRVTFKITSTSGYVKFIDIHDLTLDSEWYNINGHLQFFNQPTGPDLVFSPGVFADVLVNRNGATGEIQGYVNGVLEVDFIDSAGVGIFNGPNNIIHFFQDDFATGQREASAGTATKIEIFDQVVTATPGVVSSICSPSSPAPISGSTGAQGVLDPTNADPAQGLVWPAGAVQASIGMESGQLTFSDANNASLGSVQVPGAGVSPAFPGGKLNFINIHLTPGTNVSFTTGVHGLAPPVLLLSCQEIVLDSGSTLTASAPSQSGPLPGGFLGANSTRSSLGAGGFGPRTGALPSAGSLYPLVGGAGGSAGAGNSNSSSGPGGEGGPAFLLSAAQRITVNGTINANGLNAVSGLSTSQGGAGGSVRLAGLLVEGTGTVTTSAGSDSDNIVRSPSGPLEVQAFLQDFFAGTTTTTPIRGSAPVQPIPANLPVISLDQVNAPTLQGFQQFGIPNTGSLTAPDLVLPLLSTAQVAVTISVSTQNILDGTILVFRAVGTDGSVSTATSSVASAAAAANLTLNAGATYQVVVTPNTPFPSLVLDPAQGVELSRITPDSGSAKLNQNKTRTPDAIAKPSDLVLAEQWMKAFGMPVEMASNATQDPSGSGNGDASNLIGSLR